MRRLSTAKKFVTALKPVRDTLETLKLVEFDWHEEVVDVMLSLSSFTPLTHLEISPVLLCPSELGLATPLSDLLPHSLKSPILSDKRADYPVTVFTRTVYPEYECHNWVYIRLLQYVDKKNTYTLDLERIEVRWINKENDEDAIEPSRLFKKACARASVDFKIRLMLIG